MSFKNLFCLTIILMITYITARNTHMQLLSKESDFSQISFESNNSGYEMKNLNNGTLQITLIPDQIKVLSINSYKNMLFEGNLLLDSPNLELLMTYEDSHYTFNDVDQWALLYFDDFQGNGMGWSKEKLSTCGTNDNMFLGGYCNFGSEEVYKNYTNIPKHSMIRITANFHFFDNWEGEEGFMYFNDVPVWKDNYKWCEKVMLWYCKKFAINACGAEYPDRLAVPVEFITYHNEENFKLAFGAFHNKTSCEASWGIDNVAIYIK